MKSKHTTLSAKTQLRLALFKLALFTFCIFVPNPALIVGLEVKYVDY